MVYESEANIDDKIIVTRKPIDSPRKKILFYALYGFLILISQTILSGYGVVAVLFIKQTKVNIYIFVFFRGLISSIVTLILAYFIEGPLKFPKKPYHLELMYFCVVGFMVNNLVAVIYLRAVVLTSASYCAIFSQIIPLFSVVLFYLFKIEKFKSIREKKSICQIIGILFGVCFAIAILALEFEGFEQGKSVKDLVLGTFLISLNNIFFSLQYVIQSKLFYSNPDSILKSRPLTAQAYSVNFGCLIYTIFMIPYISIYHQEFRVIPKEIIIPLLYASIILCPISYGLMAYCSKKTSPILVGASFSLNTVTSLTLLRIFTNEKLKTIQYSLFPGVIFGVLLVVFSPLLENK